MELGGWIFLGLSWSAILFLLIYCYSKILTESKSEGPIEEIDKATKSGQ